jgi:hypothetical protein
MVLCVNYKKSGIVKRGVLLCLILATLTILFEFDLRANAQAEISRSQRQEMKKRTKSTEKTIRDLENNYLKRQEAHYKRQDRKTRKIMRRGQKQARKQASRRSQPWFRRLIFRWKSRK